jgi:hypothetical protein
MTAATMNCCNYFMFEPYSKLHRQMKNYYGHCGQPIYRSSRQTELYIGLSHAKARTDEQ